ncbi:hypothetical protein [Gordonia soli]|uniref:Uncharacterized protein n=1 Tax=Gordonia soli NBRC 108243 TaxID=1223545 RepID=M0QJP6_9ACTN|nr:hypothetical protein [Gordonia soli]GAC68679.1 hypothetical protein GS4_17_00650 [Gordonia soli NBRC 108243]
MGNDIDQVSRAQAEVLITELERVADGLVDRLERTGLTSRDVTSARTELYEVREHVRRLQHTYAIGAQPSV